MPESPLERCGLCCILIPTTTFSKEGVVCQHLLPDGESTRCAIYSSRPEECRNFSCNHQDMIVRLNHLVLQIMGGQRSMVYYYEPGDGGYRESEEIVSAVLRMRELGIFRHSSIIRGIQSEQQIPPELELILTRSKPSREILEAMGIHQFLK